MKLYGNNNKRYHLIIELLTSFFWPLRRLRRPFYLIYIKRDKEGNSCWILGSIIDILFVFIWYFSPPFFRLVDPWNLGFLTVPSLNKSKRKTKYIGPNPRPLPILGLGLFVSGFSISGSFSDERDWFFGPYPAGLSGLLKLYYWLDKVGLWYLFWPG